jgi:hypothetical protein
MRGGNRGVAHRRRSICARSRFSRWPCWRSPTGTRKLKKIWLHAYCGAAEPTRGGIHRGSQVVQARTVTNAITISSGM